MRVPCLKRNDILGLLSSSKKFYCNSFTLCFKSHHELKLTISVNRFFGKAHQRNLIKRRIYNLVHGKYQNIMMWFRINAQHKNYNDYDLLYNNLQNFNKLYNKYVKHSASI